jgi:hypothetical protein
MPDALFPADVGLPQPFGRADPVEGLRRDSIAFAIDDIGGAPDNGQFAPVPAKIV